MSSPFLQRLWLVFLFASIASGQAVPWVERHGMTGLSLQSEFDT